MLPVLDLITQLQQAHSIIKLIIDWSIRFRFLILTILLLMVVIAVFYVKETTVDAIPDLSDVQVIIQADYPGQSPNIVEDQVTYPITTALLAVPGAELVRGLSGFEVSYVYVIFKDGTDLYWARSRVLEYLNQISSKLPKGVSLSLGPDATGVGWIYEYALVDKTNRHDLAQLTSLQNWFLKFELQKVPGVSEIATVGGMIKQYQVIIEPNKLRAYSLTLAQVKIAIEQGNSDEGGGAIEMGDAEYMVRSNGFIRNIDDIQNIPVAMGSNGVAVLIKDVASVRLGPQTRRGVAELNGQGEAVGGIVVMRFGQDAMQTIQNVKTKLQQVKSGLPNGVEIVPVYDRSNLIERAVSTLKDKLIEEFILVSFICILFLFHLRSALVIILSLAIGVLMALVVMRWQGINANIMSLGGIAIAIGAMVDAVVVMVENVHKHLEKKIVTEQNRWEIIRQACYEVATPLFFSLLIITFSFLPIFTLQAQESKLFAPLAFTKTYSMAMAALLSITLVPILIGWFIRGKIMSEQSNPVNRFLQYLYKPIINNATDYPKVILFAAVILIGIGLWPLTQLGKEFMPTLNEGDILYMPTTLPSIAIDEARTILQRTDKLISSIPEVKSTFGKAGRAETATDSAQLSMFETIIQLKPQNKWRKGVTMDKIIQKLDATVKIPGLSNAWVMPIRTRIDMLSTGIKTPIGIKIFGSDLNIIQQLGKQIETLIKQLPETSMVYAERVSGGRYISISIDRVKAARYGLNIADVQTIVQSAIGGENIGQTIEGRERYPINIRYPREFRDSVTKLNWLPVVTQSGATIPLGEIAQIKIDNGSDMIRSENARLNGLVYIDINSSDLADYVQKAQHAIADKIKLPAGYSIAWSGQYEYMQRAKERLAYAAPFTLIIIALLLYFCFGRITEVIMILISLPFSLGGGIWIVYLLGYNLSVAVGVGFIALAGVATETGVIMLIYLNHAMEEQRQLAFFEKRKLSNQDIQTAVIAGSLLRLRPKIMTVCAIIGGLLPIMLLGGTGSEVIRRIAAPMIGGMISSTVLTLVIIPCLYLVWKQYQNE